MSIAAGAAIVPGLLHASFAGPTASPQRATYTQIVEQADPGLRWVPPAAIPFGEPLTPTQLAAAANTAGSMAYTPAAGEILQPGAQTLSVTFTPTNPGFHISTLTVPLVVNSPGSSSFQLQFAASQIPTLIVLSPGVPSQIPLTLMAVGDFHQPINFACSSPARALSCTFDPAAVRPTSAPAQTVLTLALPSSSRKQEDLSPLSCSFPLGIALGLLLWYTRRQADGRCTRFAIVTLGCTLLSLAVIGCATRNQGTSVPTTLTIQASSLRETRSITIQVMTSN